jgi:hypothetical protein
MNGIVSSQISHIFPSSVLVAVLSIKLKKYENYEKKKGRL